MSTSELSIIPAPRDATVSPGEYPMAPTATIGAPPELVPAARVLQGLLRPATGFAFAIADAGSGDITLEIEPNADAEEYRLSIDESGVVLRAGSPRGILWGIQSLVQLLPPAIHRSARTRTTEWMLPHCVISDAPRFPWRGLMLDVARHFLPKREVMRVIDLMAVHKLNTLHLHLTDDQGWRLQIDAFPRLTERGGWRSDSQRGHGPNATMTGRPHGGWYTKDDAREIVAYAAERGIDVVPEIEMPGHVQAALSAYPEWGIGEAPAEPWARWGISTRVLNLEEATVDAFRRILDEVIEVFPSRFIGIGGDEAKKTEWQGDARTQELMRERGLADEEAAQSWFIGQIDAHLTSRGRRAYGWDEILEGGLAAGATVASWRGRFGAVAAARAGHDVVVCPDDAVYLDYRQSDHEGEPIPVGFPLGVDDVYAFDPLPPELTPEQARHVLGGQANIWSEHLDSPRALDYMLFPRLCAVAEAVWSVDKDLADFRRRLDEHLVRLDALGVEYRDPDGPAPWQSRPDAPGKPITREERLAIQRALVENIVDRTASS
ncbi:beta-N-acetylhexosaminidase [Paramicrobacterium agarici]|uniref:beta-N-acetylhexosaminidase n=1 Tax=Paramicrobacterium agarici TaxID=630514 RepID=UPI00114FC9A1|nr:beta-N-acetylhexosaminidase [Microbacterium agarici]TQO22189.1 hexosaminidase [Microbacterium agarici]